MISECSFVGTLFALTRFRTSIISYALLHSGVVCYICIYGHCLFLIIIRVLFDLVIILEIEEGNTGFVFFL